MKKLLLFSLLTLCFQTGTLSAQNGCITWFEGLGAQPLGQPHQGCAPCGSPVIYTLHYTGTCQPSCTNLFTMQQNGSLHIDNAASYTILGTHTISITWLCNEDPSGVIYACGSDNATAINLCPPPCIGSFQYCLRVSCDTLCVLLANQPNPVVVSSPNNTSNVFCFNSPIVSVSQAPCLKTFGRDEDQTTELTPIAPMQFATPNPATDFLTLKVPESMKGKNMVRVLGIDGKTIFTGSVEASEMELRTSSWPAGVYQVQLWNGVSEMHQKVLIIR